MVIDTSAIIAILQNESDRPALSAAIEAAAIKLVSGVTFVEASVVIESRKGAIGAVELERFIDDTGAEVRLLTREQIEAARIAYRSFGKGRHPAGLNFGDCFAYALAKTTGFPVLAKGPEFARTDIEVVAL
jgi:ribonuclease VapC